jgi:hypothetical protein
LDVSVLEEYDAYIFSLEVSRGMHVVIYTVARIPVWASGNSEKDM